MNTDAAADLNRLRESAQAREWGESQAVLTHLLLGLDFYAGLEMALSRAHAHLPVFEAHHPQAEWARQLLVGIVAYGAAPAMLPPEAYDSYPSPGAANFITAVLELVRSVERKTPLENRIRFIANALVNTILAELAADWYGQHPDAWTRQSEQGDSVDPETGLTVRQQIQAQFWLDETVARRDVAAWLSLVDALAAKLNPAKGSDSLLK
ncbi:MAG: hypothetical protein K8I60_03875 [Anaerolineae bacterium]|nr:hypothetical protein [Anaerolineae bacterium]